MHLEEPTELFHYTGIAGLKGILESQTLWATHYKYLNDEEEITNFKPRIKNLLLSILVQVNQDNHLSFSLEDLEKRAEYIVNLSYRTLLLTHESKQPLVEPYITSFCRADNTNVEKHGLLSQWRGYGQSGGYAIVFDAPVLKNLIGEECKKWYYSFLHGGDVVYSDASDEEIQQEIGCYLEKLREGFTEFLKTCTRGPLENTFEPLLAAGCRYKHWGFKEEKEFRIVAIASSSETVEELKRQLCTSLKEKPKRHFIRAGMAVPYLNLLEGITSLPTKPLPIKRIIVGPPRQEQEKRIRAVEILLKQLRIHADVSRSDIPYLGQ